MSRISGVVLVTGCILLGVTAAGKAVALISGAPVLAHRDPVLGINQRMVMLLATVLELGLCMALLWIKDYYVRGLFLASCGAQFLMYHAARLLIGAKGGCPCLGTTSQWLGLTEDGATRLALTVAWAITGFGVVLLFQHGHDSQTA